MVHLNIPHFRNMVFFDIIKKNSRQRNTLKGLFSLEIDVIKVPEGKPDVFQAPTS